MTILISFFALFISLFLGFFFALGQQSRFLPFRIFSKVYVELIRSTPLLVQIFVIYYGLPGIGIEFDPVTAGILALIPVLFFLGRRWFAEPR